MHDLVGQSIRIARCAIVFVHAGPRQILQVLLSCFAVSANPAEGVSLRRLSHCLAQSFPCLTTLVNVVLDQLARRSEPPHCIFCQNDLVEVVAQSQFFGKCGMSQHLNRLMQDLHTHAWFTTMGLTAPASTELGSRAGDLLGDVLFNFSLVRIHEVVAAKLKHESLLTDIPP